jgi:hypothetical protein
VLRRIENISDASPPNEIPRSLPPEITAKPSPRPKQRKTPLPDMDSFALE